MLGRTAVRPYKDTAVRPYKDTAVRPNIVL